MKEQWPQANDRGKGATPGRANHTLKATLQKIPSHHRSPTTFWLLRYMGTVKGKQEPNQISIVQAHPRAGPLQNRIHAALLALRLEQSSHFILGGSWTGGRTGCSCKGEEVGEGPELSHFPTPHPSFFSTVSTLWPNCDLPQNVYLLVQLETLWGKSQKWLPVGSCCHKIHSVDKQDLWDQHPM